jgi:hypothetical protein
MRYVKVRVMKSFNELIAGEITSVPMTEATAHLIVDHYLELLWDPAWEVVYGASSDVSPPPQEREQEEG